jgi:hypothetical protein
LNLFTIQGQFKNENCAIFRIIYAVNNIAVSAGALLIHELVDDEELVDCFAVILLVLTWMLTL